MLHGGVGGHSNIVVKVYVNRKLAKRGLRTRRAGNLLRGLENAIFQEKGSGFVKICSNSSDSTLFRSSI